MRNNPSGFSDETCTVIRAMLDRIGDKWSLYVVGTLRNGPMRFNELKREVEGVSQRMLSLTLKGLERDGLVTRTPHASVPPRVDYELTSLGRSMIEPVLGLAYWVDRNQEAIRQSQRDYDVANGGIRARTRVTVPACGDRPAA